MTDTDRKRLYKLLQDSEVGRDVARRLREEEEAFDFEPTADESYTGHALVNIESREYGGERIVITALTDEEFDELRDEGMPVELGDHNEIGTSPV